MNKNEILKEVILKLKMARMDAMIKTHGITREQLLAQFAVKSLGKQIEELEAKLEG